MKIILITALLLTTIQMKAQEIYDFSFKSEPNDWYVVDDGVMGGRSQGTVGLSAEGHGIFQGNISLENNGGFSSIRHRSNGIETKEHSMFRIRLKGDGKNYQFRVKTNLNEMQSYVYEFETTGEWQEISIPFKEMYPSFRGRKLKMPNYPGENMSECTFLIANKKNESFRLEIDRIWQN
ncbi:CIA30 family protein [Bacteroidota bacterium]